MARTAVIPKAQRNMVFESSPTFSCVWAMETSTERTPFSFTLDPWQCMHGSVFSMGKSTEKIPSLRRLMGFLNFPSRNHFCVDASTFLPIVQRFDDFRITPVGLNILTCWML